MAKPKARFTVRHYGPGTAEDFDHSTFILVERSRTLSHPDDQTITLEDEAELDHLIACLIDERNKCPDSPWTIVTEPDS